MKKLFLMLGILLLSLLLPTVKAHASMMDDMNMHRMPFTHSFISFADMQRMHVQKRLEQVNNSGVEGIVDVVQLPHQGGTHITVIGLGLTPNQQYVSLYYSYSI